MHCCDCGKPISSEVYARRIHHERAICHPCFIARMYRDGLNRTIQTVEHEFDDESNPNTDQVSP